MRNFDWLMRGQEDIVGLRDKLCSNLTLLATFNSSLAKYVYWFSHHIYYRLIPVIYCLLGHVLLETFVLPLPVLQCIEYYLVLPCYEEAAFPVRSDYATTLPTD